MNTALDIVGFGSDWHGHPSSTHHLIRQLSQKHRILWVNSLGMRTPKLNSQDFGRLLRRAARLPLHLHPRKEHEGFWVLDPLYLPFQKFAATPMLNRSLFGMQLRAACRWLGFSQPLVLTTFPNSVDALPALHPKCSVYFCLDDFARMPGVDNEQIAQQERRLAQSVDLILVTAEHLKDHLMFAQKPIHFFPQGVDLQRFANPGPVPAPLARIPTPRIGFFGALDSWLNLSLIADVAKAKPAWHFPIIGPSRIDLSVFDGIPNVHLLGKVPYEEIPSYAAGFDIGLLPFYVDDFTKAINPLKLREYFAAGMPAISTSLPEVMKFQPLVRIADTPTETIAAIESLLAQPPSTTDLLAAVANDGWEARAKTLEQWLESYVI